MPGVISAHTVFVNKDNNKMAFYKKGCITREFFIDLELKPCSIRAAHGLNDFIKLTEK